VNGGCPQGQPLFFVHIVSLDALTLFAYANVGPAKNWPHLFSHCFLFGEKFKNS